jgi:hypothetical protein
MSRIDMLFLLAITFVISIFSACNENIDNPVTSTNETQSGNTQSGSITDAIKITTAVAGVLAANSSDHEDPADYIWDSTQEIPIVLNGTSITESTDGATVIGSTVTITSSGTYSISGSLTDGQILVNTSDKGTVRLILNGVNISNATSSPIYISAAEKVILILADNTRNYVTDGASYVFANTSESEPNATIFSKSDLTIYGNGFLTVKGNYNDGITSKDGLIIKSGIITTTSVDGKIMKKGYTKSGIITINVTSADDGIRGKDYLVIKDGAITVTSTGDGLKSDNEDDVTKGYIYIKSGAINITAGLDAIAAETDAIIANGIINLSSGGGSGKTVNGTTSAKAIKGVVCVAIDNGTFSINSADDAIHSNGEVVISGGTFDISSGDDGIHADSILGINGGNISITKCYEGIESAILTINDGNIHVTASDDGINGAGGNDGSGAPGWPGGMQQSGNYYLYINGGYIVVNAIGDGLDINGSIEMTGGTVIVNGPTANNNGAIDYDASFKMTGGFIVAAGSSGMAQVPGTTSTQYSLLMTFSSAKTAGTLFHIQASDGTDILTFKPTKVYQSVAFCSPNLIKDSTYDVYLGGSSTGTATDGLYEGGIYSGGTKSTSFTISSIVTRISK